MDAKAIAAALLTPAGRADPYPLYARAHDLGAARTRRDRLTLLPRPPGHYRRVGGTILAAEGKCRSARLRGHPRQQQVHQSQGGGRCPFRPERAEGRQGRQADSHVRGCYLGANGPGSPGAFD